MSLDHKSLKKLADTCRKAGIKSYKCAEFEFTLSDEGPISNYKKKLQMSTESGQSAPATNDIFKTDTLTDEQLLFWSIAQPEGESETQ